MSTNNYFYVILEFCKLFDFTKNSNWTNLSMNISWNLLKIIRNIFLVVQKFNVQI